MRNASDSIAKTLEIATIRELILELQRRGACYAIFREADVLAHIQTSLEYQDASEAEQLRIAEGMFEANVEDIQNAMAEGGKDYIRDLISVHYLDTEA